MAFRLCFFSSKLWPFITQVNIVSLAAWDVNLVTGETSQTRVNLHLGKVVQSVSDFWFQAHVQRSVQMHWMYKILGILMRWIPFKAIIHYGFPSLNQYRETDELAETTEMWNCCNSVSCPRCFVYLVYERNPWKQKYVFYGFWICPPPTLITCHSRTPWIHIFP